MLAIILPVFFITFYAIKIIFRLLLLHLIMKLLLMMKMFWNIERCAGTKTCVAVTKCTGLNTNRPGKVAVTRLRLVS